jgi:hypothetical protein
MEVICFRNEWSVGILLSALASDVESQSFAECPESYFQFFLYVCCAGERIQAFQTVFGVRGDFVAVVEKSMKRVPRVLG